MRSKTVWFTAIGLSSLTLLASVSLSQAAIQFWKPEVAHAAKVTVRLVKHGSFNPLALTRRNRSSNAPAQSERLSRPSAKVLATSLTQSELLDFSTHKNQAIHTPKEFQPFANSSKMAH